MEKDFDNLDRLDLHGLDTAAAKEYILGFISTLKLTEKELERLHEEDAKWERRVNLSREQGRDDLLQSAEAEREKIRNRKTELKREADELRIKIDKLKSELRILPAKERAESKLSGIDPDLLEQELLILTGRMPGEEKEARQDRDFEKLEKESSAEAALDALKARMGKT
jgi:phage shock protein A